MQQVACRSREHPRSLGCEVLTDCGGDEVFTSGWISFGARQEGVSGLNNKAAFAMGLVGLAVGALPFLTLMGVLPAGQRSPNDAPDWIGILIGLAFTFAGLMAIVRSFAGTDASGNLLDSAPRAVRAINDGLGIVIVGSLATLLSWVAFGPGERHFTVSAGGSAGLAGAGGDVAGRVMFGFGAILGWVMLGWMVVFIARRGSARR